jgi:hypothetical protein
MKFFSLGCSLQGKPATRRDLARTPFRLLGHIAAGHGARRAGVIAAVAAIRAARAFNRRPEPGKMPSRFIHLAIQDISP